jgi:phosphoglycolate phosphatase
LLLIFDLDGTLIDSSRDLAISVNATRRHFGLEPLDQQIVNSYVGQGAPVLVRRAMGSQFSEDQLEEALAFFLKYYRAHALEHTRLYGGVKEAVVELSQCGHVMAVLTNKPESISFDIIRALGVDNYFVRVIGGNTLPHKKPHPAGILTLAEQTVTARGEVLMIGDSSVDVETARNAGVRSCGVTWGLQPESLQVVQPDFLVRHPQELCASVREAAQSIPAINRN